MILDRKKAIKSMALAIDVLQVGKHNHCFLGSKKETKCNSNLFLNRKLLA